MPLHFEGRQLVGVKLVQCLGPRRGRPAVHHLDYRAEIHQAQDMVMLDPNTSAPPHSHKCAHKRSPPASPLIELARDILALLRPGLAMRGGDGFGLRRSLLT
jgi:hypothetical protein